MSIDTSRHDAIFGPTLFLEEIHVIGVGGIGSPVVRLLVKLGCGIHSKLHVWDGDTVAPHNLANQTYDRGDVGQSKVGALQGHANRWAEVQLETHNEFVTNSKALTGVVFLCVDTMSARWDIWKAAIRQNPKISLFVESRMDATTVLLHAVNPCDPKHVAQWERFWYPDDKGDNQIAGCGGTVAVGPTASIAADFAVWQFMRYAATRLGFPDQLDQQIRCELRPFTVKTFAW